MPATNSSASELLSTIVAHLDIPRSYYEKAVARHKSLGEWLCRSDSKLAAFSPHVSPQGSFRFGTVNRPLRATDPYDLDNVTVLQLSKTAMTQRQLKELYGNEVRLYAEANGMLAPLEEKDRCWRLVYADEVSFHLDTLPCVPEDPGIVAMLTARGVPRELAVRAIAITDRRHPEYDKITAALLSSNPRGFAKWFETRTRAVAEPRLRKLVEARLYASVEEVPPYEWKTPLQRAIQILKRHRDVMFQENPGLAPISMIITNLAALAYDGESDLRAALVAIVDKMPSLVQPVRPRVPNPADPAEDYADKWSRNPALEQNFWLWHAQLKTDVATLATPLSEKGLAASVHDIFRIALTQEEVRQFGSTSLSAPAILVSAPVVHIPSAPRPWGAGA